MIPRHALRAAGASLLLLVPLFCQAAEKTIAFGSCLHQWNPQPVWGAIRELKPDAFIFAGDNVYADAGPHALRGDPERIGSAYDALASDRGFQSFRARIPIYATWDDHDYGKNDAGAEYRFKEESKDYFMAFFGIGEDDPMRRRPGIYQVRYLGHGEERIQIILLDTRSFRSPLNRAGPSSDCPRVNLRPNTDADATMLGDAQWQWLADRLREPALLRILVSSIQVIPDAHCFEKWANFPRERERLFDLVRESRAERLVIVSGDRHLAEVSKLPAERLGYPLYEVTASGMNSAGAGKGEQNGYRITADNFREDHFGLIRLFEEQGKQQLSLAIHDLDGRRVLHEVIALDVLTPP